MSEEQVAPRKRGRPTKEEVRKVEQKKVVDAAVEGIKIQEPAGRMKNLTARQWAEADALWESGEATVDDLAKRFDRDRSTFLFSFKKRGVKKGAAKEAMQAKIKEEIEKQAVGEASILAARIKETKEEHYKMASGLAKLTWAEVLKAKQEATPFGAILNNVKALDAAMGLLKKAREERYSVLGLNDDNYVDEDALPELVINELTAEQVEMLRNRDKLEVEEVSVDEDADEYDVVDEGSGE